ncbi:MAG: lipid A biosynthesis lauroyl acyltransferase [Rickettsiaceae bacterium]|nr:lipid A biosynthesis lauroyl acyltransferase [Rickettsiaceae bacterium]
MKRFFKRIKHRTEYYLFISLASVLSIMPVRTASNICSRVARYIGPIFKVTRTARKNLRMAYKDISVEEEDKIIDDLWDNFGRFAGEFPHIHKIKDICPQYVEIIGNENIEHLRESGRPFLLCTGHFANWDMALRILKYLYPKWGVVYRSANNPMVNSVINKWRSVDGVNLIAKGPAGVRSLVQSIKNRDSIVMLVDQKMNDGISVPFFGLPSMTAPAIAKIALDYDYEIVPVELIRSGACNVQVVVHKPLEINRGEDGEKETKRIMSKINHMLEGWIRKRPGQWFWFHHRWGKHNTN